MSDGLDYCPRCGQADAGCVTRISTLWHADDAIEVREGGRCTTHGDWDRKRL